MALIESSKGVVEVVGRFIAIGKHQSCCCDLERLRASLVEREGVQAWS